MCSKPSPTLYAPFFSRPEIGNPSRISYLRNHFYDETVETHSIQEKPIEHEIENRLSILIIRESKPQKQIGIPGLPSPFLSLSILNNGSAKSPLPIVKLQIWAKPGKDIYSNFSSDLLILLSCPQHPRENHKHSL